jgi:DNA polymerase (family 10)
MKMSKNMTNEEVAELLRSVAAAYEVKGENRFKVIAYDRAATSVEHLTSEIKDLWDDHKLNQVPGIGGSIAQHLDELFRTGKSKHFLKVLNGLPPAMFELIKIPGIGPKSAFKLCKEIGIWKREAAIKKLRKAAERKKVREIPGFGKESEKKILETISMFMLKKKQEKRMLLPVAGELAKKLIEYLTAIPEVIEAEPLGSLRRRCATVGDIDIAAKTASPGEVIFHFVKYPLVKKVINQGGKKATIVLRNNIQVDLRTQDPQRWGSMLQYFTGSKQHNIHLREIAQKKDLSLSEYGIKKIKSKRVIKTGTEEEFYRFLDMEWIPPELREDQGEIELALRKKLPKLVERKDIKGDLHLHSDFPIEPSHDLGNNSFKDMAKKGAELGYRYVGFTEHNPSITHHTPRQIISILKRKRAEIDKLIYTCSKNLNIKILNGLEIDVRPGGELALPEKAFDFLDYAIASIHGSFRLDRKRMTKRVLRALSHPKVKILGHPTGRKLNVREGYELEWERIFDFCSRYHKALEINAFPDRLDLPDILVKEAVEKGVKLIINTDAHRLEDMELIDYGVAVARRGWAKSKDILNTYSLNEFCKFLGIKNT